jgi:hypothetical protein
VGPERASIELFGLEKSSSSFDGGEDEEEGEEEQSTISTRSI